MMRRDFRYAIYFHSCQNHSCDCLCDVGCRIVFVQSWNHIAGYSKPDGPVVLAVVAPDVAIVLAARDAHAFLAAPDAVVPAAPVAVAAVLGGEVVAAATAFVHVLVVGTFAAAVVAIDTGSLRFAALGSDQSYRCPRNFRGYCCFLRRSSEPEGPWK